MFGWPRRNTPLNRLLGESVVSYYRLHHRGLVGLYQSDRLSQEEGALGFRFHENGTVEPLAGEEPLGEPLRYSIEKGEVVVYQS